MSDTVAEAAARPRHLALAILLIVGGALGLLASFSLMKDDLALLADPTTNLGCTISAAVQCGKNIGSWQGSVFGFPNPMLGLMTFPAPIIVGVALLGRVSFPNWFWLVFNAGHWFAIIFIGWLSTESIFFIGTLCPWCALVYAVVIPMWLAVTLHNMAVGRYGHALIGTGSALLSWVPLLSLVLYVVIALEAQLRLDIISQLFH
ncbi:vitamin K epoxide reductase family protein [Gryllotalpicola protaetiae]|uniref:vitamin K epoxide reductase family protein n=1 Tax=Gryllotalpicola protaetiae TaxID=2419771 RepID=UPI001FE9A26E|nr:vitamin K epoxide reductase family protein [Gryllotalpicola protaetiae]